MSFLVIMVAADDLVCNGESAQEGHMMRVYNFLRPIRHLFVLRFYGPVNPVGSCRARSVYLTTRLLGRFSPLSA